MSLTFFKEELDDIHAHGGRFRKANAIRRWRAGRWLADTERRSLGHRHKLGDGCVAVEHGDGLASAHSAQVFAEPRLESGNAYLLHDHIITRSGHFIQGERRLLMLSGDGSFRSRERWPGKTPPLTWLAKVVVATEL